jgi:hypothetical protein
MAIKIRDWEVHFERDRTKQWKALSWVPVPNKQGSGYRKIMKQKNGLEIFACWIALVQVASTCKIRGDLTKYEISEISDLCMVSEEKLTTAIKFLSEVLDWIEVTTNLDTQVNNLDVYGQQNCDNSSILFNSILSNSSELNTARGEKVHGPPKEKVPPSLEDLKAYCEERNNGIDPQTFYDHYEARGWIPKGYTQKMKSWKATVRTWEKNSNQKFSNNSQPQRETYRERKARQEYKEPDYPIPLILFPGDAGYRSD